MCTVLAVGLLLLAVLAGYMVLLKACAQEGKLKVIGQIISWIVIVIGFIGILCSVAAIHCYQGRGLFYKKGWCYSKSGCDIYQKQPGQCQNKEGEVPSVEER